MTVKKYKLNDIAKDLGLPAKEVAAMLAAHFGTEPKKTGAVLTEQEVNVVFEHYTSANQVANFDGYFASREEAPAPRTEKPSATEKAKAVLNKAAEKVSEKLKASKTASKAAVKAEADEKPAEKTAPAESAADTQNAPVQQQETVVKPAAASNQPEAPQQTAEVRKTTEEKVPQQNTPEQPEPVKEQPAPAAQRTPAKQDAKPADKPESEPADQQTEQSTPANKKEAEDSEEKVVEKVADKPEKTEMRKNASEHNNNNSNNNRRPASGERRFSSDSHGGRDNNRDNNRSRNGGADRGQRNDRNNDRGGFRNNDGNRPRPQQNAPARPANNHPAPAAPAAPAEPVEKERTIRHVDTKTSDVNLDKYNEHYEDIAPEKAVRRGDSQQKKQKLKQKSQQQKKGKFGGPKKETEAEKLQRLALERARKQQLKVMIPDEITVSELASRLKATVSEVIKKLMMMGVMAAQHEVIDFDTAALVAMEMGAKVEKEVVVTIEEQLIHDETDNAEDLLPRCPVVVVMGHVDHGKTSILDRIRHTHVTAGEAGGITQAIGAYQVDVDGSPITFLDTPGHEAFTAMRARGAAVTDIAVLVVAADDGIMPQTVEAINHAKAAGVQIIVAINKMDKPHADPERVKQELTEYGLVPEEWGGDIICVPVSALTGQGIDDLLENILLVADVQELKANPNRLAKGAVIEARLDKGRGPVATLLVQNGTLRTGDIIIAGTSVGRVRQMLNDKGQIVTEAGPSVPVEITGMAEVPAAGDIFNAVENERLARELVEQRRQEQKEEQWGAAKKVTLDNLFSQIAEGERKELDIVVKADVQGSAEAVKQSLEKLSTEEVKVKVIHAGVGAVSKSDVMLANASGAIIIGFNVRPDPVAKADAEANEVEMRMYRIIYDAIDDVKDAMKGMLAPKVREVELGRAEVRQGYKISNGGTVAGAYVLSGKVARDAQIRVVRDGIVIVEDQIDSLKRFKNDAKEVAEGYECGISLVKFSDIKEGDIFEAFKMEEYREE